MRTVQNGITTAAILTSERANGTKSRDHFGASLALPAFVNAAQSVGLPILPSGPSPTASVTPQASAAKPGDLAFLLDLLETSRMADQIPIARVPLEPTTHRKFGRSTESNAAGNQPEKQKQNGMASNVINIPSVVQDAYHLTLDNSARVFGLGIREVSSTVSDRTAVSDVAHGTSFSTECQAEHTEQRSGEGTGEMQVAFVARVTSDDTPAPQAAYTDKSEHEPNAVARTPLITPGSLAVDSARPTEGPSTSSVDDTSDSLSSPLHPAEPIKTRSDSPVEDAHSQSVTAGPLATSIPGPPVIQDQPVLTGNFYRNGSSPQNPEPPANMSSGLHSVTRAELSAIPSDQPPVAAPSTIRELTLRVGERTGQSVDVRILDQGEAGVRISVRSGDGELNSRLQSEIPRLVASLHDNGLDSEVWTPQQGNSITHSPPASESRNDDGHHFGGSGHGGQQQNEKQPQQNPHNAIEWEEEIAATLAFTASEGDQS